MAQVVTLCARRGEDRRIGYRRDVVAIDCTRERRADSHEEQRVVGGEHADHDGKDKRDRAPGSAHGEADERRHQEDDCRQKGKPHAKPVQHATHKLARSQQVTAQAAQAPRQNEDHNRADHRAHAFGDAFHKTFERRELTGQEHRSRDHERHTRSDAQARHRVLADSGGEVDALEETAHVHHAENREHDQHDNGDDQVEHAAILGDVESLVLVDRARRCVVDVGLLGHNRRHARMIAFVCFDVFLGKTGRRNRRKGASLARNVIDVVPLGARFLSRAHRAVIELRDQHEEHEEDREQGVEVVGDGLHERREAVFSQIAAHGNRPRRDRRNDAHRRRRGVDDPRQFLAADMEAVGDGTHDRADRQTVKIVVHEDEDAENRRENRGEARVLHVLRHPFGVGARAAGDRDDHRERAQ